MAVSFKRMRIGPRSTAESSEPMMIAICWWRGVAPTRKPVLRSCDVVPPFEAAMHTMPPTDSAVTYQLAPTQPTSRKMRQVRSSVATVMPEMGFDDEPISPVRRLDTVTNRNPNTTIRIAPSRFMCSGGESRMASSSSPTPPKTKRESRSRSVRTARAALPPLPPPRTSRRPSFKPWRMMGSERNRLMIPAAATAPAPM